VAAKVYSGKIAEASQATGLAKSGDTIAAAQRLLESNKRLLFNNTLDAFVAGTFLVLVLLIVTISVREWILLLARKRLAALRESDPVWLPEFAVAEERPLAFFSLLTLAFALAKELSGEAALDRAQQTANACACGSIAHHTINWLGNNGARPAPTKEELYVETLEKRFNGINRCC
jgi:carbon starvation protein